MKSTINGNSTYFVGSHYEVTGTTITKYYFAGSQRIAMREGSTVYYLLSDHLGSTSLTTDAGGSVVSEMRYSVWGGVRYQTGTTPSEYTFTGQYSNISEFGLMFYNARWYDPAISHFVQADTVIPGAGQSQAWDRYSYTQDNPVRYNDPTGHSWEDCGDKNGYSCRIHMKHVAEVKNNGNDEKSYKRISRLIMMVMGWGSDCEGSYKGCWYSHDLLRLEVGQQIDINQMIELMTAVYYDLKHQTLGLLPLAKGDTDKYRFFYDTPFWNGAYSNGVIGDDTRICLGADCYRRSDVNYFAQGMWGAASGETLQEAVQLAADYKLDKYSEVLSPNTEYWITVGYDIYNSLDSIYGEIASGDFEKYFNK